MNRIGELFVRAEGTKYRTPVWYDPRGRYVTEYTSGTGDFVFHVERSTAAGTMIFLRCKQHGGYAAHFCPSELSPRYHQ